MDILRKPARPRDLIADNGGAAAIEFALWSVLFFMVVAVGLDFGTFFLNRSKVDEALSATAVSAFTSRASVPFNAMTPYARSLSGDPALAVTLTCNGAETPACTNTARQCACLSTTGAYTPVNSCSASCGGTTAGYYLTISAKAAFKPLLIPGSALPDIDRHITVRLQ